LYKGVVHLRTETRDYDFKLNRKVKTGQDVGLAHKLRTMLSSLSRYQDGAPKTRQLTDTLKSLNVHGKKVLFVMPDDSENLFLSLRNVPQ